MKPVDKREAVQFLKGLRGELAVFSHNSPDLDAVASLLALKELLKALNPSLNVRLVEPPQVGPQVREFLAKKAQGFDLKIDVLPQNVDSIAVVDTSSKELTSYASAFFSAFRGQSIVIDHHSGEHGLELPGSQVLLDTGAVSCTQVVLDLFKESRAKLTVEAAELLALGLLTDSAFFAAANSRAFQDFAECLSAVESSGGSYSSIAALARSQRDFSERIARFKAARRVKVFKAGDFVIATSEVGSFEASAATGLVALGADASFVLSEEKDGVVISARASNTLSKAGAHLGNLMSRLSVDLHGTGGGHPGAAALTFYIAGRNEDALRKCVEALVAELKALKALDENAQVQEY